VPIVYRKCAGGGLLRDPDRIDRILGALREAITIVHGENAHRFSMTPLLFDELPSDFRHAFARPAHRPRADGSEEMYRVAPRYDFVATARRAMPYRVR